MKTAKYSFIALYLLSGLTIALLTSLLIYFRQKPILHHALVLICVAAVFVSFYFIHKKFKTLSWFLTAFSLITICIICWFAPQFIYQIRAYTFYITGVVIGLAAIMAVACNVLDHDQTLVFPNNILTLSFGYLTGAMVSPPVLLIAIAGLLMLFLILRIFRIERSIGLGVVLLATYMLCMATYIRFSSPMLIFEEQSAYEDKVIFASETQFHKLVITQWHNDRWFFMDQLKNVSSIDEFLFYEPMVHSVFNLNDRIGKVLVAGGENGCLVREVLKHPQVIEIDVVHYDTLLANLGRKNHFFTSMNLGALDDEKVNRIAGDLLDYIAGASAKYDAIFIDLPDPRSIETNQYYTLEFYRHLSGLLETNGVMITQAGSPYFASEAFNIIGETIRAAGLHALPMHNQILTLGEWGWYVCSAGLNGEVLKQKIIGAEPTIETRWWNSEAAKMVTSFGKTFNDSLNVGINTLENPLVYQSYLKGTWDLN